MSSKKPQISPHMQFFLKQEKSAATEALPTEGPAVKSHAGEAANDRSPAGAQLRERTRTKLNKPAGKIDRRTLKATGRTALLQIRVVEQSEEFPRGFIEAFDSELEGRTRGDLIELMYAVWLEHKGTRSRAVFLSESGLRAAQM